MNLNIFKNLEFLQGSLVERTIDKYVLFDKKLLFEGVANKMNYGGDSLTLSEKYNPRSLVLTEDMVDLSNISSEVSPYMGVVSQMYAIYKHACIESMYTLNFRSSCGENYVVNTFNYNGITSQKNNAISIGDWKQVKWLKKQNYVHGYTRVFNYPLMHFNDPDWKSQLYILEKYKDNLVVLDERYFKSLDCIVNNYSSPQNCYELVYGDLLQKKDNLTLYSDARDFIQKTIELTEQIKANR